MQRGARGSHRPCGRAPGFQPLEHGPPSIDGIRQRDIYEGCRAKPGVLGLAWLLTRPAVAAPIIGPRTRDQLHNALTAVELTLSPQHLDRLDEIFPGRKTAPEDYAW